MKAATEIKLRYALEAYTRKAKFDMLSEMYRAGRITAEEFDKRVKCLMAF